MSKQEAEGSRDGAAVRRGGLRRAARFACWGLCAAALLFALGFGLFVWRTMRIAPPQGQASDAIIVLTGGRARVETGLALLEENKGGRLLISGVSPMVESGQNLARIVGADPNLLECCVDLGREAVNTSGNALESAAWLEKHGYHRALIVTSRYHMLRALAELRHAMPQTKFVPFPVDQASGLWESRESFRLFATEYVKFLVVRARNFFT